MLSSFTKIQSKIVLWMNLFYCHCVFNQIIKHYIKSLMYSKVEKSFIFFVLSYE